MAPLGSQSDSGRAYERLQYMAPRNSPRAATWSGGMGDASQDPMPTCMMSCKACGEELKTSEEMKARERNITGLLSFVAGVALAWGYSRWG
jgi:hypothetical protein